MTNDLINPDIAPTTPEQRTWRWYHYFALWLGMVIAVPAYMLASGFIEEGMSPLQAVTIVLDLTHGNLGPMQYHPSAGWLKSNGYATDLAKCVHLPRAADVATKRNVNEQPWVILHELAHAYHDQVLGFDEPRVKEAYEKYKKSGRGDKTLLFNGKRVKHYALTTPMEFFAEMTEAYFGTNDFFPFNRAELKEAEPEIFELLTNIWESPPAKK